MEGDGVFVPKSSVGANVTVLSGTADGGTVHVAGSFLGPGVGDSRTGPSGC